MEKNYKIAVDFASIDAYDNSLDELENEIYDLNRHGEKLTGVRSSAVKYLNNVHEALYNNGVLSIKSNTDLTFFISYPDDTGMLRLNIISDRLYDYNSPNNINFINSILYLAERIITKLGLCDKIRYSLIVLESPSKFHYFYFNTSLNSNEQAKESKLYKVEFRFGVNSNLKTSDHILLDRFINFRSKRPLVYYKEYKDDSTRGYTTYSMVLTDGELYDFIESIMHVEFMQIDEIIEAAIGYNFNNPMSYINIIEYKLYNGNILP